MKLKSWSKYFIYIFLILVMVFWGQHVFQVIEKNRGSSFNPQYFDTVAMTIIFYGSIGLILGVDHFICEMRKEGTWIINLPKILLMGIPSLYFSLGYLILFIDNQLLRNVLAYPIFALLEKYSGFISIFPLILGYSIITSLYKHN